MRNAMPVLATLALGACAASTTVEPVSLAAPTPDSPAVTLECVTRELDNFGYETEPNRSESQSVTGIRVNERPWYLAWLYGNTADQISASVDQGQLHVTAVSSDPQEIGEEGPPESTASETAARNAREILQTCS